jgi:IgA Peptidase M64/Peptidase M64 N-terminus
MRFRNFGITIPVILMVAMNASAAVPGTMRLDFFHIGNVGQELFSVDRIVIEPLAWPGNPNKPIDSTNRGTYLFEIKDQNNHRILYSRGFSSIYGEWVTTDEAKKVNRTFHESLRFPAPDVPVQVVVKKRNAQNIFVDVWSTTVDPHDKSIDASKPPFSGHIIEIQKNGDPSLKVDLLFLGEGYSGVEQDKCEKDIRRLNDGVFTYSPFKERRGDFNVWAICAASPDSGVSHPSRGLYRNTLFGSQFDVFGEERYALSFDNRAIRNMAAFVPYDVMGIVMNSNEYGNGGIFGIYASVSIDYPSAMSVFVHEFGHHFADLGDEYYFNANVAYSPANLRVEPWEPNITALLDAKDLKWKTRVAPGTPIPTPWPKEEYEKSVRDSQDLIQQMRSKGLPTAEIQAAQHKARDAQEHALSDGPYSNQVGAFAGAMYENGYYRPQQQCIMISGSSFCTVCQHAIEEIVDLYSRP